MTYLRKTIKKLNEYFKDKTEMKYKKLEVNFFKKMLI